MPKFGRIFYLGCQPHLPDVFPILSPLHLPHPRLKSFPLWLAENSSCSQVKELNRLTRVGEGRKNKTRREASPPSPHGVGLCDKSMAREMGNWGILCAGELGAVHGWDPPAPWQNVEVTLGTWDGDKRLGRSSDPVRVSTFWAFPAGGWLDT